MKRSPEEPWSTSRPPVTTRGRDPGRAPGLLHGPRKALRREAAYDWRIGPRVAEVVFLVPLIGAVAIALARTNLPVYDFFVAEDSVLEWVQFAGYLVAAAAAAGVAVRLHALHRPLPAVLFLLLGVGSFFIAGEEIAWGQRLLGFGTPEELAAVNHQNETTVHNVSGVQTAFNVVLLGAGAFAGLGPWLARRRDGEPHGEMRKLLLPPLFLSSAFLMIFLYKAVRFLVFPEPEYTVVKFGEWPELCMALGLAAFAVLTLRRLYGASPAPPAAQEERPESVSRSG